MCDRAIHIILRIIKLRDTLLKFRARVLRDTPHSRKDIDKIRLIGEKRARGITVK